MINQTGFTSKLCCIRSLREFWHRQGIVFFARLAKEKCQKQDILEEMPAIIEVRCKLAFLQPFNQTCVNKSLQDFFFFVELFLLFLSARKNADSTNFSFSQQTLVNVF